MTLTEIPTSDTLLSSKHMQVVVGGITRRVTMSDIAAAAPDSSGIYPDVPFNRVEIRRAAGAFANGVVLEGNLGMVDKIFAMSFPCLLDNNSVIQTRLDPTNVTKTEDGDTAPITSASYQCMVRLGGIYHKFETQGTVKVSKFSIHPVKGYRYVRRRFIGMYSGFVENGKLYSRSGVWSTQSLSTQAFHNAAKALGSSYRLMAHQDYDVYRWLWWLLKKTYNSQSIYNGVVSVNGWNTLADDGGKTSYGRAYINGCLNTLAEHEGQKAVVLKNGQTHYPNRFMWCEGLLSGPMWIWCSGRIKKGGKWYDAVDVNNMDYGNINVADTSKWRYLCDEGAANANGYITDTFEDTGIATAVGGSATTYFCDNYWRGGDANALYVPAVVGSSWSGSDCGVSVLLSNGVVSDVYTAYGACLASDDPTDRLPDGATVG